MNVQPEERRSVAWSFGYFVCLLSGYYILRPVRDALAVAGGAHNVPWMFTGTMVAMIAVTPIFGRLVARMPRRRFVPLVYRCFLVHLLGFMLLLQLDLDRALLAPVYFIWLSVYNLFVVSLFWSVMADVFQSGQGKRLFGVIAAGGSLGALLGSSVASAWADSLGVTALLAIAAALLEAALWCFRGVTRAAESLPGAESPPGADSAPAGEVAEGAPSPASEVIGGGALAGAAAVTRSAYLATICLYIVSLSTASTFLYMQRAEIVARAFSGDEARVAFFALVDLMVNLVTIALQLVVTSRLLGRLGVGATLAILPVLSLLGFSSLAAWPTLAVLVAFQALLRALRYAVGRPARELLFTVVSREHKYKSKNFIDTVVYRAGDAMSSWLVRGLTGLGLGLVGVALVAAPLAALWFGAALWLGREQTQRARAIEDHG